MTEQEKIEHLKFISQTHRELHHQRRQFEIRVLLITLSAYGLAAFAALKGEINAILTLPIEIAIWVIFLILAVASVCYLRSIHAANRVNIKLAENIEDEIIKMVNSENINKTLGEMLKRPVNPFWSWGWQAIIIIVVAIACAFIITFGC